MCFASFSVMVDILWLVPGDKFLGTMLSIHNVVTVVMDMFQFELEVIT